MHIARAMLQAIKAKEGENGKMPRKFVYDYYDVFIPWDAVPEEDEKHEELFRLALLEAEQRSRIYAIPCVWHAQLRDDPANDPNLTDFHVRVCRKRYKTKRPHFHMLIGMPGYMPDTNYTLHTRGDAEHAARWEAQEFCDDWDCVEGRSYYKVAGNMHDGYEIYRRNAIHPEEVYMTIRVTECYEEDCLKELEEEE